MTTPQPDLALPTLKPAAELERLVRLAPGQLAASPTNPRKHFDPDRVAQIADSMRQVGQIQPIRARSNPLHREGDGRPPYEIVVGETRWRAVQLAGLPALDVILREYSDLEVIEVQLVENLQRNDLHPMEEAEGYEALLRKPAGLQGYATVEEIAARVGKSPSYVYQRLKLLALCPAGREAFYAGKLSASVALLIARMPDQAEQARATARIVAGWGGDPYSFRQAAEFLQKEFMLRLSLARFDVQATYQVAGPCAECPKRSGAAPDLFADVTTGDMCLDARCYQAKAEEAHQLLLQAARNAGRTVLQGAEARRVLPTPGATPVGHYRLDEPCPALTDSGRTLRAILGTALEMPKSKGQVVVVDLPDAAPVELVTESLARTALKARGLLREQTVATRKANSSAPAEAPAPAASPSAKPASPAAPPPAGRDPSEGGGGKAQREAATEVDAMRRARKVAGGLFEQQMFAELCRAFSTGAQLPLLGLRLAVELLFYDLTYEGATLLYEQRGWADGPVRVGGRIANFNTDFKARLDDIGGRELGELLMALLVLTELQGLDMGGGPDALDEHMNFTRRLAVEYAVDLGAVWASAKADAHGQVYRGGEAAGSAAGSARRELTPTEAFMQQHSAAASGRATTTVAGSGQQDQTDEGPSDADD